MATTIEELEQRVAALEAEVAIFRQLLVPSGNETPAERGARAILMARLSHPAAVAILDEVKKQLGIEHVKPVGAEKLQEMMREAGIKPEDNEFSREIIRMREE
jgi:3-methyladenine DNA glycosylase/8-oxoguanine DNA glycosylase